MLEESSLETSAITSLTLVGKNFAFRIKSCLEISVCTCDRLRMSCVVISVLETSPPCMLSAHEFSPFVTIKCIFTEPLSFSSLTTGTSLMMPQN